MELRLSSAIFFIALSAPAFANNTLIESTHEKFYVGAFGGGGSSNSFNASQLGTVFFIEAAGGPLAVNAFGRLASESSGLFGTQLGYQAQEILLNSCPYWTLGPAAELEWYTMSHKSFNGTLINNTDRPDEHNFEVSYPMSRNIFLANAVLSFNNPRFIVHPYIGLGIGNAIVRISNATSVQTNPPEAGLNHYNADTSDTNSVFAGQVKLGLSYNINKYLSIFADYRWLYLASSHFVLGSTVYPGHAPTSSWQVKLDAQKYNLGNIGIRFTL